MMTGWRSDLTRGTAAALLVTLPCTWGCADRAPMEPVPDQPAAAIISVPAKAADAFVNSIGINVHVSYFRTAYGTGWATIIKPKLFALRVRHLRDAGAVVTSDGWMQTVYGRMKELADSGIRFNLIMKPAQGITDYTHANHFPRLMQYAAPVVESFEGLNEHDASGRTGWVTEVRTFQKAVYARVKGDARSATLPVFGPSMALPINAPLVGDLSPVLDYGALHPYPGGQRPMALVGTHIAYGRTISGARPLVATESGYHTALSWTGPHPPISQAAMARYVPRLFLDYFNAGFRRTWLYELIDEGTSQVEREQAFGLLRADGTAKPAYDALRNLIALLRDPGPAFPTGSLGYALIGDTTNVRRLLLQKRDGRYYLVLWHDAWSYNLASQTTAAPSTKAVTLQLAAAVRQVRSFAPLSSTAAVQQWQGAASLALTVPDSPLVLELTP